MKYIVQIIFIIGLLSSCNKELPYPDVDKKDVIILNALITPEDGATIHLSQSCQITDLQCTQNNIENAQVF